MDKRVILITMVVLLLLAACSSKPSETNPGAVEGNDNENELEDLFSNFNVAEYKVIYAFSTTGQENNVQGEQTIVMKSQNVKVESNTEQGYAAVYFVDGKVYSCTESQGEMNCFEFRGAGEKSSIDRDNDLKENWRDYSLTLKEPRTIAGTSAICFEYTKQGKIEYCYSRQGVPLYVKTTYESMTTEMTAKEYSTSVLDSEFELPATPQALDIGMRLNS